MGKTQREPSPYMDYPKHDARETGCKVSWLYYADEAMAREAAIAARHNDRVDAERGYDFGYCSPGSVGKPSDKGEHAGLWRVCIS